MTNEERNTEGADETVEDLEAPADAQADVAGGAPVGCGKPSMVCTEPTCQHTQAVCVDKTRTHDIVVFEQ